MTQEEKKLLEVELATRSQYGVICAVKPVAPFHELEFGGKHKINNIYIRDDGSVAFSFGAYQVHGAENIKPYLRPMSSMTDEEYKEYDSATDLDVADSAETLRENLKAKTRVRVSKWYHGTDWLNAHHFDYRGLIPMGLALEATESMYKTE